MYPTPSRPQFGISVARQAESLRRVGISVQVEIIKGWSNPLDYMLARFRLKKVIRRERPDLIHAHYGYTALSVAFLGRPFLVTLCGDDVNGESNARGGITFKSRIGILVTKLLTLAAARVIVMSEPMRQRLWPVLHSKTEVLPYGIDNQVFFPRAQEAARARLGINRESLVVAFVNSGRQPTKRLDIALATRDELARRGLPVQLLVAENVPPEEMPWYYQASDCLLLTSDSEGSPNCVKEALQCGVPVIGVPIGDLPDLVNHPARGRLMPRDPVQLADAVQDIMKARGRDRISLLDERLLLSSIANRLVSIYQEVVAKHYAS